MNLMSCDQCGVVLDKDKLTIPDIIEDDGGIDTDNAGWTGDGYAPIITCPVCKGCAGLGEDI